MPDNPPLPKSLIVRLLDLLDGSSDEQRLREGAAELCSAHPEHAEAIRSELERAMADGLDAPGSTTAHLRALLESKTSSDAPGTPEHIGPYRILEPLGEGGMGTVYRAEQREPVKRQVALKLIKLGMDSKEIVRRFEQERQALALMDHEGIAKVFDCGTSERGQPFFVMELVKGIPLDEFCEQNRLSLDERLRLMQQVCAAVQHAHQKGVVHRDLKPGNVLVSSESGRLQVKIIDFGLAKAMGQKLVEATLFTEVGQIVGTPEYMAPEQADPSNEDIDTRADIYSLGVMLYQVLAGELPFPGAELRKAGMLEIQRILREVDPPKPSTRVTKTGAAASELAKARRVSVGALNKALRTDLDWVVLKALEKDRNRRYDTANALSADLQRYLDHEPLVAGPPSAAYRLQKLLRRYRGQFVAAGLVLLTIVVGGSVAAYLAVENAALAKEKGELAQAEAAAKTEAQTNLQKFEAKATELDIKVTEFNQLAGVVRYDDAVAGVEQLLRQAAWPTAIPAMESWLADCDELLGMRQAIERTIDSLREDALPWDEARQQAFERAGERLAAAEEAYEERPVWEFAAEASGFLHDTLVALLGKLDQLESTERAMIAQRIEWARQIETLSLSHPNADVTWGAVRKGIAASDKYAGQTIELRDRDVLGLVPLGPNPKTGYFEFYHLRSAWDGNSDPAAIAIPAHEADGSIAVTGATGIVFVLLPGGTVTLGSQSDDKDAPFYDPQRKNDETLHEVTLSPFFLARHELTQGQWARLWNGDETLRDPSRYKVGRAPGGMKAITLANPVEQVDSSMCDRLLASQGLLLPTEAQWEHGCRGGSTSAWIVPLAELKAYANVADATAKDITTWACETWTDGHVVHAPVGSFLPNGFGLYHVHGNVFEWCRDWYGAYGASQPQPGDGLRKPAGSSHRVFRGGSFDSPVVVARSAFRGDNAPTIRNSYLGLRPARASRIPD